MTTTCETIERDEDNSIVRPRKISAADVFHSLAKEVGYGFNMQIVLGQMLDKEELRVIEKFIGICKDARGSKSYH